jgi:hypothetical protein
MGKINSKTQILSNELESIKKHLAELSLPEKNNTITKEEFIKWQNEHNIIIDELKNQMNNNFLIFIEKENIIGRKIMEIEDLKLQIENLKRINKTFENDKIIKCNITEKSLESKSLESKSEKFKEISQAKINEFVNKLLNNKEVNVTYLPDWVEAQLYKNVFTIFINVLDDLFDSISLKIIGHELKLKMSPENDPSN